MRERERQTATKPRYYIRGIEITAQTGLGRFGGAGWPRPRLRAPSSCRPPGPRSCQLARYPRTTPPPFRRPLWPSSRVGFAPIPTKSGASRASGWICGSRERRRPGPAHRGQRRTRPPAAGTRSRPDTAEDCGSDCGSGVSNWARTPTGFESPAHPPQAGFGATSTSGSRADPRERGPPCAGGHGRLAEAGACRSS